MLQLSVNTLNSRRKLTIKQQANNVDYKFDTELTINELTPRRLIKD